MCSTPAVYKEVSGTSYTELNADHSPYSLLFYKVYAALADHSEVGLNLLTNGPIDLSYHPHRDFLPIDKFLKTFEVRLTDIASYKTRVKKQRIPKDSREFILVGGIRLYNESGGTGCTSAPGAGCLNVTSSSATGVCNFISLPYHSTLRDMEAVYNSIPNALQIWRQNPTLNVYEMYPGVNRDIVVGESVAVGVSICTDWPPPHY